MMTTTQIVYGGGWRRSRTTSIHVKAWIALLFSLMALLTGLSVFNGSLQMACLTAAGVSGLAALVFFVREKPKTVEAGIEREPSGPHNLHLAAGSSRQRPKG